MGAMRERVAEGAGRSVHRGGLGEVALGAVSEQVASK